ncbi:unnamed protein product [Clavelina lepadiformis]|uniref:Uncharacterized protein n=1 Tax=Clavelina lepadiformis TaxID=159417 RepID=A0ABP0FUT0_CLALP
MNLIKVIQLAFNVALVMMLTWPLSEGYQPDFSSKCCEEDLRRLEERVEALERRSDQGYFSIGCWRDTSHRAIPTAEGTSYLLDGAYGHRSNPIEKCARVARERGCPGFAIQNGGWCATSPDILETYDKFGRSNHCKADGEGGPWANEVYQFY